MSSEGGGSQQMAPKGPPYAPTTAQLGGQPTIPLDVPICAVLLLLYIAAAVTNMAIFQVNRKRDHKFIFSALLFGFCMARITTLSLRIAWAAEPRNIPLAIAASIFVQAGVLLLFIVNLIFAQRIVRSYHPQFGWSRGLGLAFKFLYFCVAAMLIMVITAGVYTFYTLNVTTRQQLRDIQLFAGTFLAVLAFLPIPITLLTLLMPRSRRPEKFGQGRYRTKLSLLLFTTLLLSLGAGFRIGVNFTTPRALTNPAWYHSKACFYCFNFVIELVVVYLYAISRFDRRFHIPNGSSGPGHYSGSPVKEDPVSTRASSTAGIAYYQVNRESDVFGADWMDDRATMQRKWESDWEARALEELNRVAALEHI